MDSLHPLPRHMKIPGEDGYRTPTVEDAEYDLSTDDNGNPAWPPAGLTLRHAHTSALDSLGGHSVRKSFGLGRMASKGKNNSSSKPNTAGSVDDTETDSSSLDLSWKERIRHFTWAYFTLTMATGGIANVLYAVPFRFRGLETIGIIVFLLNIVLYIAIWTLLIARFYFYPYTLKASFLHPTESLFVPASIVSFGTILINISQYGPDHTGHWLARAVGILFWIDAILAVILSAGIYLLLWSTQTFTIARMTPVWIFPAYPMLIIGPHAGILSGKLEPYRCLPIIIGGTTIQGVGFLMSLMVYSAFVYRLMSQKLPKENLRPAMFVSVGPSAFTVSGIVNMAAETQRCFPDDFMGNGPLAANILKVIVNFGALWLWGLAIFFFFVASFAHWSTIGPGRLVFTMGWFSFVFPNTALITATFAIGNAFSNTPILIVGCAMIIPLVFMYIFVCYMMVRAIVKRQILWPQKGEDKDEGGFEMYQIQPESPDPHRPMEV